MSRQTWQRNLQNIDFDTVRLSILRCISRAERGMFSGILWKTDYDTAFFCRRKTPFCLGVGPSLHCCGDPSGETAGLCTIVEVESIFVWSCAARDCHRTSKPRLHYTAQCSVSPEDTASRLSTSFARFLWN